MSINCILYFRGGDLSWLDKRTAPIHGNLAIWLRFVVLFDRLFCIALFLNHFYIRQDDARCSFEGVSGGWGRDGRFYLLLGVLASVSCSVLISYLFFWDWRTVRLCSFW